MASYVKLGDADRQRLDCKEWLPTSIADITADDMDELSERFGFDPMDWPEPLKGTISLEDAGQGEDKRKQPKWYLRCLAWMALRQNGHDVSWDDCGMIQVFRMEFKSDEEEEPGKAQPDTTTPSESSDASTTTPSESSSD